MNVRENFRSPEQAPGVSAARGKPKARRVRWDRIGGALIALAVILAGLYAYFGTGGETAQPEISTAVRGDVEDVVTAVGTLQPLTSVDVGAQVSGQLKKLYV